MRTILAAVGGGDSPQSSSTRRSTETASFACRSSTRDERELPAAAEAEDATVVDDLERAEDRNSIQRPR